MDTWMSNEEIVETLKSMVFGKQAFEKFGAKERHALNKAWNIIDQYEQRLKSDMVFMLTDLQLEIMEQVIDEPAPNGTNAEMACYNGGLLKSHDLIQEKIDKLKEESKVEK